MKKLLISLFGTVWSQQRGVKLDYYKGEETQQETAFDEGDEAYRVHFYPKSGSSRDEYVLFKVGTNNIKNSQVGAFTLMPCLGSKYEHGVYMTSTQFVVLCFVVIMFGTRSYI